MILAGGSENCKEFNYSSCKGVDCHSLETNSPSIIVQSPFNSSPTEQPHKPECHSPALQPQPCLLLKTIQAPMYFVSMAAVVLLILLFLACVQLNSNTRTIHKLEEKIRTLTPDCEPPSEVTGREADAEEEAASRSI